MGEIKKVEPVKLISGIIAISEGAISKAVQELRTEFGEIDIESELIPFTFTDYYEEEMGKNLLRKFVSFSTFIDPAALPDIKIQTNSLEKKIADELASASQRPVNLDPGYVSSSKLVLATTKNFSHRIYLRDGIYAEVTLSFKGGKFAHFDWTYPDYRTERYKNFFEKVRAAYMTKIKGK